MKAVVLAGGEGTRLRPLTKTRPKPLMPIADRPCIEYILRSLVDAGIKKIIVATHYLSDKLIKTIGDGMSYGASIIYSFEEKPAGTAGAVRRVEDFIDGTFVVAMGDIVADVDIGLLVDFHKEKKAVATIALTEVDNPSQYGVALIDESGRILKFKEKPKEEEAFSNLVNAGIYVLEASVLEFIPRGRMFDFSKNLFPALLAEGLPVYGRALVGTWMDIGRPNDLLRASLDIVRRRGREVAMKDAEASGLLLLGEDVIVGSGARIEGPCYLGSGVRIGARAQISRSCLHEGVIVGESAIISDSLLFEKTRVGRKNQTSDSVLASNCEIGDESRISASVIGEDVVVNAGTSLREAILP